MHRQEFRIQAVIRNLPEMRQQFARNSNATRPVRLDSIPFAGLEQKVQELAQQIEKDHRK